MPTGLRRSVAAPAPRVGAQLQSGTAGGTVLALPREYATSCLTLAGIVARAGWLATELVGTTADNGGDDGLIVLGARLEDRIVPLVYTHAYLVARGRPAGMTLTYEGVPLLGRAGWAAPPGEIQP
jgi:hypothetical protein